MNPFTVNETAVKMWPYLERVIERINKASEQGNVEALTDVFQDAGKLVSRIRSDFTVTSFRMELRGLLWAYRREVRDVGVTRKLLERGLSKRGKPLAPSTLKQRESFVRNWPGRRDKWKTEIRQKLEQLRDLSNTKGRTVRRGDVSFRVINGGQYPARVMLRTEDSWAKLR